MDHRPFTPDAVLSFVFFHWPLRTTGQLVLGCLAVAALSMVERLGSRLLYTLMPRSESVYSRSALKTAIYALITIVRYIIMLAIMTGSRAIFCTVILSLATAQFVCEVREAQTASSGYINLENSPTKPAPRPLPHDCAM
ncbi:hypothetical protein H4R33_002769 [Dimargaris cristalligena]|uniref:Copper transport protein n=1 Tax=Dimargaris cristalligena TaxID=215637 RepID=A0A4P9ZMM8_9FUNG|nr:hypothetical protein H4R33_002769 [Dimargaris cristalligena]RKP34375.1 hypothetical protein BJ085DRAFT_28851 [Dimargaris cristalligena]|eukprot:RKP34375.1 hypothetical protein BJ085DRAFT_28851 [Dimargaris cristalligena]